MIQKTRPSMIRLFSVFGVWALLWAMTTTTMFVVEVDAAQTAAGLETLIGIRGRDFVILGADSAVGPNIIWTSTRVDKIAVFSSSSAGNRGNGNGKDAVACPVAAAVAGDAADADRLVGLLQAQATLYEYEQGIGSDVQYISMDAAAAAAAAAVASDNHLATTSTSASTYTVTQLANLARSQIAHQLRSRSPCRVCMLIGGLQPSTKSQDNEENTWWTQKLQDQIQQASPIRSITTSTDEKSNILGASNQGESSTTTTTTNTANTKMIQWQPRLYWLDELGTLQEVPYGAHGIGSVFMHAILDAHYRPHLSRDQAVALIRQCFAQLRQRYAIQAPQPPCLKCIDANGVHLL